MRSNGKFLVAITASLFILACTPKPDEMSIDDRLSRVQNLIDENRYDEARDEVNYVLEQKPDMERAHAIKASISVHQAGIRIRDYFILETLFDEAPKGEAFINLSVLDRIKGRDKKDLEKLKKFLKTVNDVAITAQNISEKFEIIPVVDQDGADHLYNAVVDLENLKDPSNGVALFRGVIKLFYFKFLWRTQRLIPFGEGRFCAQSLGVLSNRLQIAGNYSVGMINDLAKGFPKSRASFESKAQQLGRAFKDARSVVEVVNVQTQTVQLWANAMTREQGLGEFQCDF